MVQESDEAEFSAQDISNCFYEFVIPDSLGQHFGLRPLTAAQLGLVELDGTLLRPEQLVYPVLRVLPMGFSHSVHWIQEAHRELLCRAGLGSHQSLEVLDKRPAPSLGKDQAARLLYIDNELFLSTVPGIFQNGTERWHIPACPP